MLGKLWPPSCAQCTSRPSVDWSWDVSFVWEPASHGFLRVGHWTSGREALTLDERHIYHSKSVPNSLTCGVRYHLWLELRGVEVQTYTFQV